MQLTKDIAMDDFQLDEIAPLPNAFEIIFQKLWPVIELLEKENPSKLARILNRIDISEKQLNLYIKKNKEQSFAFMLSELIIKRVLQKVVIRQSISK